MKPCLPTGGVCAARCSVSVIIRAFNQEKSIAAAIESSLAAAAEVGGEVVLADAHSTDRTVEIASNYPIRIVQLLDPGERRSGVTPQLGYQHSRGDYVYLLNGDSRMICGFLPRAMAFLAQHPEAAGVAGRAVRPELTESAGLGRCARPAAAARADRLEGGALFRRRAIQESGYLSDRNLHSHEEFDLALRMRALGWKLWCIPVDAVSRDDETAAAGQRLPGGWRAGAACGAGELLRAAVAHPRLRLRPVLRGSPELRSALRALAWSALMLSVPWWPLATPVRIACLAALAVLPWLLLLAHTRSPAAAFGTLLSSCVNAAGLLRGLAQQPRPPREPIASRVLQDPPQTSAPRREHYA